MWGRLPSCFGREAADKIVPCFNSFVKASHQDCGLGQGIDYDLTPFADGVMIDDTTRAKCQTQHSSDSKSLKSGVFPKFVSKLVSAAPKCE
jgi:hypothetical protein